MTTTPKTRARSAHIEVAPEPIPALEDGVLDRMGHPRFGVHTGIPATFDYSTLVAPYRPDRIGEFLRHKRWMYLFAATDDVIVCGIIANAGPVGTGFLTVIDRATGDVLADASRPGGAGPLVSVGPAPVIGHDSRYNVPGTSMTVRGDESELQFQVTLHRIPFIPLVSGPWVELDLRITTDVHEGTTTVAEIQDDELVTATSKNAALPTRGSLVIHRDGHTDEFDLSGVGGFDYTNGYLPRATSWRWAFTTGTLDDGRALGINLVSGFTGLGDHAHENVAWLDGSAHRLDPTVRIIFDEDDPMAPWQVTSANGSVDLEFTPLGVHRESLNLGVIRSKFLQPAGHFSGTVVIAGQEITLDAMPGVVENQDVLW